MYSTSTCFTDMTVVHVLHLNLLHRHDPSDQPSIPQAVLLPHNCHHLPNPHQVIRDDQEIQLWVLSIIPLHSLHKAVQLVQVLPQLEVEPGGGVDLRYHTLELLANMELIHFEYRNCKTIFVSCRSESSKYK